MRLWERELTPPVGEDGILTRKNRIDREPVSSAAAFSDHLRVMWLVPAMDGLFDGPASERRRFLDRLVLAVDAGHSSRVAALERALRSRNRLLEEPRPDAHWLDAIEHETAELAVAVSALRVETVARLQAAINVRKALGSHFPAAELAVEGWMEKLVALHPAVEIEDRYRAVLRENRTRMLRRAAPLRAHISAISPCAMPARTSPRPTLRRESKRRCLSAWYWHMPGC